MKFHAYVSIAAVLVLSGCEDVKRSQEQIQTLEMALKKSEAMVGALEAELDETKEELRDWKTKVAECQAALDNAGAKYRSLQRELRQLRESGQ